MNITINATLIVQLIHFFIAYLILRIGLYRPLVAVVHKHHSGHSQLRTALVRLKQERTAYEEQQRAQWQTFCGRIHGKIPRYIQEKIQLPSIERVSAFTSEDEEKVSDEMANLLVKSIRGMQ